MKSNILVDFTLWERHSSASQEYPPGVVIFRQNAIAREVFIVLEGLVKLVRSEANGAEIIVGLRSKGALLGAGSLLIEEPHSFTAITVSKCIMLRLSAERFRQILQNDPPCIKSLCQALAHEAMEHVTQLSELACLSARARLELFLWENVKDQERDTTADRVRLQLPLRECEVAQVISITPVHLSRLLSQVEKEGLVTRHKGWLLVDLRRLKRHAT